MDEHLNPDRAEEQLAYKIDNVVPTHGYRMVPIVGLGGSAGGIEALQLFFSAFESDSFLAFVVVIHLAPDHESTLAELIQRSTRLPVIQVHGTVKVEPGHVYVIPPGKSIRAMEGYVTVDDAPSTRGRHIAVDVFFRTLADTHGAHAAAVVLSGMNGDGAIGIKRIKERGGLTIAQDPDEAEHASMPQTAIATGMVDWVLPVGEMPARLQQYFKLERLLKLPSEDEPPAGRGSDAENEAPLRDVLAFLRSRTGRDFAAYKRATVLRRIARRMQVNGVDSLSAYLGTLRTQPGETNALLQDLLITVTNFFRDPDCFEALAREIPALFEGKSPSDTIRVWVAACATGEEAYSMAMLLSEHARTLDAPPLLQIFATDLDEDSIQAAREGIYPFAIEADVSEERLKRYFVKEHRGYRVRRELREMVLFALHDVLKDSPFSRLDLVSCRNLLIYLNRSAQERVFETFHFALLPEGRLFLGSSESVPDGSPLFSVIDKKHRMHRQRPAPRAAMPVPTGPGTLARAMEAQQAARDGPVVIGRAFDQAHQPARAGRPTEGRGGSWGELHLRLLEQLAPPSILVDSDYDIVHLSPSAGRFLQYGGGEPSRNLLRTVDESLRIELRATLYQAGQSRGVVEAKGVPLRIGGQLVQVTIRVSPATELGTELFLVQFEDSPVAPTPAAGAAEAAEPDPVARHLDRELERLKSHLRDTVEQYEASTEELKASNEELQAMNEELRSATEELETSREELQSINEELTTVNHELKSKVEELGQSNSDMHNLMDATAIATVFLDRELRITRFTPSAVALFNLINSDLGRPLSNLTSQLSYPELNEDARRVLEKLVPIEREVGQADNSWFLARLLPYRTIEDRIAGVVLSFVNITERKRAEEMRLWLSAVVKSTPDAIFSFSLDGSILSWNDGAEKIFGYTADEAIGEPLAMLSPDDPESDRDFVAGIAMGRTIENYEARRRKKDGGTVHVSLSASPIVDTGGRVMAGTAVARDITQMRAATEALRVSEERMRLVVESARDYAIFSMDLDRRITTWNPGAERLLGFAEGEAIGRPVDMIFTPEDRAAGAPQKEVGTAMQKGRASDERVHQRKDQSRFWASGSLALMRDDAGEAVGFVKILQDRSELRAAREALRATTGKPG